MLEIRGDLFTFGGQDDNGQGTKFIHRLTLTYLNNRLLNNYWTTINQKLKIPRYSTVAIPVAYCTHVSTKTTIPTLNTARIKIPSKTLNPTTTQTTNITIMTTTSSKEKSTSVLCAINDIFYASYNIVICCGASFAGAALFNDLVFIFKSNLSTHDFVSNIGPKCSKIFQT